MIKVLINQKSALLILCTLIVLSTSCSKDDDPKLTDSESNLIGTWTISEDNVLFDAYVGEQTLIDYIVSEGEYTEQEAELLYELFKTILMDEFEISGTMEFRSDNTYTSSSANDDPYDGTWKLSSDGKTLTLDEGDPNDEVALIVNSLTSSTLSIELSENSFEDLDDDIDTPDVEITIKITISLTK